MFEELYSYPAMRPSTLSIAGNIPTHWSQKRLRYCAQLLVSSVDKKEKEQELPVRLCNYVDVYRHEIIRDGLPFMKATATEAEIEKFRLKTDDVIITKDSEDWLDIGVPAYSMIEAPDLVCGYHLAILRPDPTVIRGQFLYWYLRSATSRYQFNVRANGVTRYGLSHNAIKDCVILLPPLDEQLSIVVFLNYVSQLVDRYVKASYSILRLTVSGGRQQGGYLREYHERLISDVVTGKLDVRAIAERLPSGLEVGGDDTEMIDEIGGFGDEPAAEEEPEEEVA